MSTSTKPKPKSKPKSAAKAKATKTKSTTKPKGIVTRGKTDVETIVKRFKAGDTVEKMAKEYGVSERQIKWRLFQGGAIPTPTYNTVTGGKPKAKAAAKPKAKSATKKTVKKSATPKAEKAAA